MRDVLRNLSPVWSGVLVLLVLAAPALAEHPLDGTWELEVDLGGQGGTATLELKVEEGKVSGTYSGALGEQPVTGTVDGDQVELAIESTQAGEVTYSGTLAEGTLSGKCTYGQLGEGTFEGKKKEG